VVGPGLSPAPILLLPFCFFIWSHAARIELSRALGSRMRICCHTRILQWVYAVALVLGPTTMRSSDLPYGSDSGPTAPRTVERTGRLSVRAWAAEMRELDICGAS